MSFKKGPSKRRTLKHTVFSHSPSISKYLNHQSLLKYYLKPELRFLTKEELALLEQEPGETARANKLLYILDNKSKYELRKFTVCLMLEQEHKGHIELTESILTGVNSRTRRKLYQMAQTYSTEPAHKGNGGPAKPVSFVYPDGDLLPETSCTFTDNGSSSFGTLIYLTGDLAMEKKCTFRNLDERLWEYFSTADYTSLEVLVNRITLRKETPQDWKIIGSWFRALILMHRDHDYSTSIHGILEPALQECVTSDNRAILEGRILQHMAKMFLVMNDKRKAQEYYEMAKEKLQFVGGGYDKANMFCREAKLSSATCKTREERDRTERLYETALDNVPADASYALASRPSLILSKAAFHLRLSFGKGAAESPLHVASEELDKAKKTLKCLPEKDIILDIRKCEHSLLVAEMTRLEGDFDSAACLYKATMKLSEEVKLGNITDIAKSRIDYVQREIANREICNELLEGLPNDHTMT